MLQPARPRRRGQNHQYSFLLVNVQGSILEQATSGDFDFSTLPAGMYQVHGLSYKKTNAPASILDYLTAISGDADVNDLAQLQTDNSGVIYCMDLSEATAITIKSVPEGNLIASTDLQNCTGTEQYLNLLL